MFLLLCFFIFLFVCFCLFALFYSCWVFCWFCFVCFFVFFGGGWFLVSWFFGFFSKPRPCLIKTKQKNPTGKSGFPSILSVFSIAMKSTSACKHALCPGLVSITAINFTGKKEQFGEERMH